MSIITAILRVIYDRNETKPLRIVLEAALCGALSLVASAGISAIGLHPDWSIFTGGAIGYLGSTTVRAIALRFIKTKVK